MAYKPVLEASCKARRFPDNEGALTEALRRYSQQGRLQRSKAWNFVTDDANPGLLQGPDQSRIVFEKPWLASAFGSSGILTRPVATGNLYALYWCLMR